MEKESYYIIGIKGTGLSALAQIYHDLGYKVEGSDIKRWFKTEEPLKKRNIKINEFNSENIKEGQKIIYGGTFNNLDNPEMKRVKELNLPCLEYFEELGKLTGKFNTISVTGCHGKTTTTAFLAYVFNNIKKCNYLIGDGTGHVEKESKDFIIEACEYKRHFLNYKNKYSIITNIDLDHVDYYKDINDVISAYQEMVDNTEEKVIACGDFENVRKIKSNKMVYYGFNNDNDVMAKNIKKDKDKSSFDLYIYGDYINNFEIKLCGDHMILNALAVITVCYLKKFDMLEVQKYLKKFTGAKRRFDINNINGSYIIDDYAHHPEEIKATLNAARQKFPNKKIIAIYEGHTYSRVEKLYKDFAKELNKADKVFIKDIEPAREKKEEYKNVTYKLILNELNNGEYINIEKTDKLLEYKNQVFIFMSPKGFKEYRNILSEKLKNN